MKHKQNSRQGADGSSRRGGQSDSAGSNGSPMGLAGPGEGGVEGSSGASGSGAGTWGGSGAMGSGRSGRPIPPKLYRISEILEYSGVSRQTIHNYTTMGLITEARRTTGGHRLYDESVFGRLDLIEELKRRKRSLRDIRTHFADLDDRA